MRLANCMIRVTREDLAGIQPMPGPRAARLFRSSP
jgi:hypothetical protein